MKYLLISLLFLVPFTSFAAFDQDVSYGATGSAVSELQEFLGAHAFFSGPYTGNFYSLTLNGVKRFQLANGIPTTGYFGPLSRAAAQRIVASETVNNETSTDIVPAPVTIPTIPATTTHRTYTPRTSGQTGGSSSTITAMPELTCSLEIGDEGTSIIQQSDGSRITVPSKSFPLDWSFTDGAIGVLTSDNDDGGTLNASHGSRTIRVNDEAHYKLTVSMDGANDVVCTASAKHQG